MPMHLLQPTLNGGEAAPGLWHRVDLQKFTTWVRQAINFFVRPQGGLSNRAGTQMLAAAARNTRARLIPFVFSKTQAYALEFGAGYIRFFNAQGAILDGNGNVYEVATDYTEDDVKKLYYCQIADIIYLACEGRAPKQLARYGHTQWVLSDYDFQYGPLKLQNTDEKLKISANYNSTEQKYYLTCENDVFKAEDVGAWWKIKHVLKSTHYQQSFTSQSNVVSDPMLMSGELMVQTTGTWAGTVAIQYSTNPSDTNSWANLRTLSSVMYYNQEAQQNISTFNANDTLSLPAGLIWVRVVSGITNGTCYFTMDCDEQDVDIFYKVTQYIDPMKVQVSLINTTTGLESYFSSGREYKSCIEKMTSGTATQGTWTSLQADAWKACDGDTDTYVQVPTNSYVAFTYEFASAVVINSIAILGHNMDDPINPQASADNTILLNTNLGPINPTSEERGEEVTYTAGGVERKDTWRILNFTPNVATEISFSVNGGAADKYLVEFKVRGYDYVAGQEITINATAQWSQGAWSTKNGWPTCVTQHGGRLVWGQEDGVQGTQIGNNNSFATSSPLEDSDGISTTLRDEGINAVNALASMKSLLAFTAGGVFASNSAVMTPTDAGMPKQSAHGGGSVRPSIIGTRVLYVLPKTGKLFDSAYDYSTDAFNGGDLCLIAEHLFENENIVEMAYQQEPYGLLWVVLASGKLLCLTYVQSESVCAWTQMQTAGLVESVCTIPGELRDELFLIVNRNGVRYVEKMADRLASKDPAEQFFVDCGRTYRGAPASVISGLDYLEGKTVAILADGKVLPQQVVTNGQITLDTAASVVHVGLPFTACLRTLSGDLNSESGSSMARKKRYVGAMISFVDSNHAKIGCKEDALEEWLPEFPLTLDTALELRTADKKFTFRGNYEQMPCVIVKQEDPLPLTVTAIMPVVQVGNV